MSPQADTTMPSRGRTVYGVHIWALIGINGMFTGLLCTVIYCELRWLKVMLSLPLANCIAATWSFVLASARNPLVKQLSTIFIILLVLNLKDYKPIFEKCDTTTSTYRDCSYLSQSPTLRLRCMISQQVRRPQLRGNRDCAVPDSSMLLLRRARVQGPRRVFRRETLSSDG
jgi:hypothetical protein